MNMKINYGISRRELLRLLGLGGAALITRACVPGQSSSFPLVSDEAAPRADVDLEISLRAIPGQVNILPGEKTIVWQYKGEVVSGPADALTEIPGSYLGPIIRARKGQSIRIHFHNELPEPSIVHWHGLHVPPSADGHPRLVIDSGEIYTYEFSVLDRAGTYWYHPHPHGRTGPQVYAGLAGLFIIHDQEEDEIQLPGGEYDVPLVIQDRIFDDENQLIYGSGHMMDRMVGFLGNQILVNGSLDYNLKVQARPYRLRLLNGSNSRIYKLARQDGKSLVVLGTDGGLLDKPISKQFITLAPAQRLELWMDFSQEEPGTEITLINLPYPGFGGEASFPVTSFEIGEGSPNPSPLPESLTNLETYTLAAAVNAANPRSIRLDMGPGMVWRMNGRTFEMDDVAGDEMVKLDDLEVWDIENLPGRGMGMMGSMSLPHPIHLHGLQFQVVERNVSSSYQQEWQSLSEGLIDAGWHDTVLVMPGERVKILMKFKDFTGLYLYHCHNLEHEDMGMMRNYRVDA
jgi:FtsP/CotA-like multicopper oxidase with cupredoxin domain